MLMLKKIRHAVWDTPEPLVTTALWNQRSWNIYENRYRPIDYIGGRYDLKAWNEYVTSKEKEYVLKHYKELEE